MNYADILRESRNTPQSCFMQYDKIRQKKPNAFIAFLEGYDAPYYLMYIENITGLEAEQIICKSKKNVIAVHNSLADKKLLKKAKVGFFVDRDYDDNSELIKKRADFYITKGYSVENYYCSKEAFEKILKNCLHYNCAHKDYDVIVENYTNLQHDYNLAILDYNAWYCCLKRNNLKVDWSLSDTMPYVVIDLKNFKIDKNYNWSTLHHDYPAKPIPVKEEIQKWTSWIMQSPVENMRGKYEFDFLVQYLRNLPNLVNNPASGFEKHAMKFNLCKDEILSSLAQYADKDDDLADYIRKRAA